jgi:hypothetical protein
MSLSYQTYFGFSGSYLNLDYGLHDHEVCIILYLPTFLFLLWNSSQVGWVKWLDIMILGFISVVRGRRLLIYAPLMI